jgi:hypothetical protein
MGVRNRRELRMDGTAVHERGTTTGGNETAVAVRRARRVAA